MDQKHPLTEHYERRAELKDDLNVNCELFFETDRDDYVELLGEWDTICSIQVLEEDYVSVKKNYDDSWTKFDDMIYANGIYGEKATENPRSVYGVPRRDGSPFCINAYNRQLHRPYTHRLPLPTVFKHPEKEDLVMKRLRRNNKLSKLNNKMMERMISDRPFPGNKMLRELADLKYFGCLIHLLHKRFYKGNRKEELTEE